MPLYQMKPIWTPLELIGIKFFKCDEGKLYIKFWGSHRKQIFK